METEQIDLEISDLWIAITRHNDAIEEAAKLFKACQVSTIMNAVADLAALQGDHAKTLLQALATIDNLQFHCSQLADRLRLLEENWE